MHNECRSYLELLMLETYAIIWEVSGDNCF